MDADRAVQYLSSNRVLHIDMLETIHRGQAHLMHVDSFGVLLRYADSPLYMLSASSASASESMIGLIPEDGMVVAHQRFSVDQIIQRFGKASFLECYQAAYFGTERLAPKEAFVSIRPMDERSIDFVMEHYRTIDDREYLLACLASGWFHAAYVDGVVAGFMGVHGEGSLGMLEVFPSYRRRGIAQALVAYLANLFLEKGLVPFAQVRVENQPSIALNKKLGFELSSEPVWWME